MLALTAASCPPSCRAERASRHLGAVGRARAAQHLKHAPSQPGEDHHHHTVSQSRAGQGRAGRKRARSRQSAAHADPSEQTDTSGPPSASRSRACPTRPALPCRQPHERRSNQQIARDPSVIIRAEERGTLALPSPPLWAKPPETRAEKRARWTSACTTVPYY